MGRWARLQCDVSSAGEGKTGMDLELDGHTAVVIGGSSGIGAAVADVLAEEGCDVAVTYRSSRDGAQQAAGAVRAHGRRAWVVPLELRRPESATEAADALSAQLGRLDAVVLCAGHNVVTPFGRITAEEWNGVLEVNLSGAFFTL
jgi:3-oxoacyl-[acyl-carrier protein] reductase